MTNLLNLFVKMYNLLAYLHSKFSSRVNSFETSNEWIEAGKASIKLQIYNYLITVVGYVFVAH